MTRDDIFQELLQQGYTEEEEAEEKIREDEEEQEHLAFFRFQEIYNRDK